MSKVAGIPPLEPMKNVMPNHPVLLAIFLCGQIFATPAIIGMKINIIVLEWFGKMFLFPTMTAEVSFAVYSFIHLFIH